MQNHSGEHIYSGLVHKKFGYDNVGFHMDKVVTVDFSGPMTMEEALEIEKEANQLISYSLPQPSYGAVPMDL
jgi:alanyl-tRNA synthetase